MATTLLFIVYTNFIFANVQPNEFSNAAPTTVLLKHRADVTEGMKLKYIYIYI